MNNMVWVDNLVRNNLFSLGELITEQVNHPYKIVLHDFPMCTKLNISLPSGHSYNNRAEFIQDLYSQTDDRDFTLSNLVLPVLTLSNRKRFRTDKYVEYDDFSRCYLCNEELLDSYKQIGKFRVCIPELQVDLIKISKKLLREVMFDLSIDLITRLEGGEESGSDITYEINYLLSHYHFVCLCELAEGMMCSTCI